MAGSWVVEAELVADLGDVSGSEAIVGVGFPEHGPPTILTTPSSTEGAPFGRGPRRGRPYPAAVVAPDGTRVKLGEITAIFPEVLSLPGDEFLVVSSRCSSKDQNANVYGVDGTRRRAFRTGDGVQSIQATVTGDVWVSYFDEGIFGNCSWGDGEPPSASGLARFDTEGLVTHRFSPPAGGGEIHDCYALNVAQEHVWAYYYSAFDLVRIDRAGRCRAWRTPVAGADALTVHRNRVLLYGGYGDERAAAVVGRLGADGLEDLQSLGIVGSGGDTLVPDRVVGRGQFLHLLCGTNWFRVDLARVAG